ncbi:MAG: Trm112 family protein [Planctomycetota bacterium]|jgi:uncharacterized protein YbaR (Trm112 family)|nr:Trm112 family protein [Planctomycetota bacterium]
MTLDPKLLEILACPENHTPVALADAALLQQLNERVKAGALRNRKGDAVGKPIEAALVRDDGKCVYLIEDGIPNMLIDERIDL